MNTPLIKWTGSKRPIAEKIVSYFPDDIETYYEPFLGGGSVFWRLLRSAKQVKRYKLSDKNQGLIDIFGIVKDMPDELISSYKDKWECVQRDSNYFYEERDNYNTTGDPYSFYFLTRTCYNGTIRYNRDGKFNTSHHFGRPGMHPDKVGEIILFYHNLMQGKDITFECKSYEDVIPAIGDVLYLDPPYTNTKALYYGNISFKDLIMWLGEVKCSWFMNINGVNETDNEEQIELEYTGKEVLVSGKSPFSKMKGKEVMVGEYFYYKIMEE